jgi:hypothetical protein
LRKFLAILISALFILSFAASSFAIHAEIPAETQAVIAKGSTQITLGGLLRIRGWWADNTDGNLFNTSTGLLPADLSDSGSGSRYDQRFRIFVDAKVTPNVQGYIMLQGDWVWGPAANTGNNQGDEGEVIQAWIQYTGAGLLGVPAGIKIGHMPLALGHQTFFQHTTNGDDAIVLFADPTKAWHVALLTIKLSENFGTGGGQFSDNTNDLDAYVFLTTYKMNGHTLGANYTYLNQSDANVHHSTIGVHAAGSFAGLGYKAEANYQFGEVGETAANQDIDADAWSVMLGLNYKVNPVNLRASFGYGTGDDDPLDNDNEEFQTFLSPVPHLSGAIAYEYHVTSTGLNQITGNGSRNGLANATFYNLGLDYSPTKNLTTRLDGYIFRASDTVTGSKDAGWEIDAGFVYSLARNLKYYFDIGYFDADDFYTDSLGIADPEEVTLIRQQFILSF